jgi:hypothetical protein
VNNDEKARYEIQDDENIYPAKDYLKSITEGAKEHKLPQEYLEFVVSMSK